MEFSTSKVTHLKVPYMPKDILMRKRVFGKCTGPGLSLKAVLPRYLVKQLYLLTNSVLVLDLIRLQSKAGKKSKEIPKKAIKSFLFKHFVMVSTTLFKMCKSMGKGVLIFYHLSFMLWVFQKTLNFGHPKM